MIESELHRFDERYALGAGAMIAVERATLGTDYGANGYTTLAEADEIGACSICERGRTCSTSAPGAGGRVCTSHTGQAVG